MGRGVEHQPVSTSAVSTQGFERAQQLIVMLYQRGKGYHGGYAVSRADVPKLLNAGIETEGILTYAAERCWVKLGRFSVVLSATGIHAAKTLLKLPT